MKSMLQVVVPIAILMGVVGLVAYFTQFTDRKPPGLPVEGVSAPTDGEPLSFNESLADLERKRPVEVEYLSKDNRRDAWMYTSQESDVKLALNYKSCTCTDVTLIRFHLTHDEWDAIDKEPSLGGLARLAGSATEARIGDVSKSEFVTIPGTPKGKKPLPYILRMNWEAKEIPGDADALRTLSIKVIAQAGDGAYVDYNRELKYLVVPSVGMYPLMTDFGEISPNGRREAQFYFWSFTREHLAISGRVTIPASGSDPLVEPCAEFSPFEELTKAERTLLPSQLGKDYEKMPTPLCAYRVTLTLHERRGEHQLELGPISRRLAFAFKTSDEERRIEDLRGVVTAVVRGEVNVLNGDENGRVSLGIYKYDRPRKILVRLGAQNPAVEIEVESTNDEKITAKLKPAKVVDGRKEWELEVDVAANYYLGEFPPTTLVILKTLGPNARKLRIPLIGKTER